MSLVGHGIRCQGIDYEIIGATGGDAYIVGGSTVFDEFDLTDYSFLTVSRGGVLGNTIEASPTVQGVFKLRSGMSVASNQETRQSDATLHVRPSESFIQPLMGTQPAGREHYRLTLQRTSYSDYTEGS